MKLICHNGLITLLLRLGENVRGFTAAENFIKAKLTNKKYKPLWLNKSIFVIVSKWRSKIIFNSEDFANTCSGDVKLEADVFDFEVPLSHLYRGSHENDETYLLSLFFTKFAITLIAIYRKF